MDSETSAVHADQRNGFGSGRGVAAAQRESRDIHAVFAESAADVAITPG